MFGLFPRKGTIAVGSDADIVVFDPKQEADARREDAPHAAWTTTRTRAPSSRARPPWSSRSGKVIIEGDKFVGKKGAGRFIKRGPSLRPLGCDAVLSARRPGQAMS